MLNRTNAPVRASGSDDKRIGYYRPIFSTGLFGSNFRFPPEPRLRVRVRGGRRFR
jgi:hypothetical protein